MDKINSLAKASKVLAIIAFSLTMTLLLTAIISDIAIFYKQIFGFLFAIIGAGIFFLFTLILFAVSFVMIFGIFLMNNYGFWPLTLTRNAFHEFLDDIHISSSELSALKGLRWFLIIMCVIALIIAIISFIFIKHAKKVGFEGKTAYIRNFDIASIIFSILGFAVSLILIIILSFIN